jgi:hypothetical protein
MEIENFTFKHLSQFENAHLDAFGFKLNKGDYILKSGILNSSPNLIAKVAVDDNVIASFYGVYYCNLINELGNNLIAVQSGDTMTSKAYRGKGLFITLAKEVYKECVSRNVKLVFGVPSESSYGGFKHKLNWTFKQSILRYSKFIPTLPISYFRKVKFLKPTIGLYEKFILNFYKDGTEFSVLLQQANAFSVERDGKYWKTKLSRQDVYLKSIRGFNVVFKITQGVLWIGDIDCKNEDEILDCISALQFLAGILGCNYIKYHFSSNSSMASYRVFSTSNIGLPLGYFSFDDTYPLEDLILDIRSFDLDTF